MNQPDLKQTLIEEFSDFFWETGQFAGRKLGIEEYNKWLSQAFTRLQQATEQATEQKAYEEGWKDAKFGRKKMFGTDGVYDQEARLDILEKE